MERQYVRVRPSREKLNPDDVVSHISSLHKLTNRGERHTIKSRLNPLEDSSRSVPEFEFLAISQSKDSPVEFFYGTSESHLNALKNRLTTAYPSSFDVEVVDVNVLEKIIPPERYAPQDFVKKMQDGHLLFDSDAAGAPSDIEGDHTGTTTGRQTDSNDGEDGNSETEVEATEASTRGEEGNKPARSGSQGEMQSLDVARPSDSTKPSEEDSISNTGEEKTLNPEDIDGYDMLAELDAGLLDLVDLPEELAVDELETQIDGPTWTEDGDILARPTLENGEPVSARWDGSGERKQDWMTTMKMFSKVARPGADDIQDRAPLATLIQHLADSDLPIAFQVCFKRIEDWSRQAERRKDNLHLNRDTLGQKVMYELGEIIHSPSKERRRERMRDYMEDIGESADQNAESPIAGDVGKRRKLIDNKIPKRTFRANIRAVSVANDEIPVTDVERTMDDLASVLDHLDGYFYGLEPTILRDGEGYRNKKRATEEFHRLVNREIVSGSGKERPDVIVNADELANFITVPSSKNLTVEGVRGTRAEAEARDPLAKPDPDLMREFHSPGMRIGYALDKEAEREPVPTQVPPSLLTTHYGRFATTGAGKSKALINDILSLHENTDGPVILVDPKGDGMTQNYMKAHFERFGEENFKENVIHYPIPDILPGVTFFNINPAVDQGMRRSDAVQNKADHYQELLKLVMGREKYEESKVAPTMISALIKALFDEYYVGQQQKVGEAENILQERETANKFTHRHLEKLTKQVRLYGASEGDKGNIPQVSDEAVRDTLEEQAEGDSRTFSTIMNAVFNRLNYIREDEHLRKIFNNTEEKFDFRDHLNDKKVILFDMGDLRDDATMVMTGLILTNLWDALKESDRSSCTQGHKNIDECRAKAERNGLDPSDPRCREPWDDDHLVNLIIDEAASVAVSSIMDKMLEQGRSFHLSVGLSMQFPEQMKGAGTDRTYKNVLNNIGTKLIGKITLDEEIAKAMAHEGMDVTDFSNRISALPRGEWIAQLPSPRFMETGPEPFSLQPLPIPSGHPESKHVLTEEAEQRFDHFLENQVHRRTQEEYGIDRERVSMGDGSPNQQATNVDSDHIHTGDDGTEDQSTDDERNSSDTGGRSEESNSEAEDLALGDVSVGADEVGGGDVAGAVDTSSNEDDTDQDSVDEASDEEENTTSTTSNVDAGSGLLNLENEESLAPHLSWVEDPGLHECELCGSQYFSGEREDAVQCCEDELRELIDEIGVPGEASSVVGMDGYVTSPEREFEYNGEKYSIRMAVADEELEFSEGDPVIDDVTITKAEHIIESIGRMDRESIGAVISTLIAETPPEYQLAGEEMVDWLLSKLDSEDLQEESQLTEEWARRLIYETPPGKNVDFDIRSLLERLINELDESLVSEWENNGVDDAFKRFSSGPVTLPGMGLARPGKYGMTYSSDGPGFSGSIDPQYRSPATFGFPEHLFEEDGDENSEQDSQDTSNVPVKPVSATGVSNEHLQEYGITREEAKFMRAVVMAVNGDLEGYNLRDSMSSEIRSLYDPIDEEKLREKGYLKKQKGADRRVYYTVTNAGQEACRIKQQHGREIGDLGDETPHRVGVELCRQYYETLPSTYRVEVSAKEGAKELDLAVYNERGSRTHVIEVEGGRISADSDVAEDMSPGINDYESVRKDYELLANSEGESVWVVRNHEVAASVLSALSSADDERVPFFLDRETINKVKDKGMMISTLNKKIKEMNDPGVGQLLTYKQLRTKLTDNGEE